MIARAVAVVERSPELVRVLMQHGASARTGIYPHRDATSALTIATERGYDEIVAIIRLPLQFRERPIEPMTDRDIATAKLPLQLDVVVPRLTQCRTHPRHRHNGLESVDDAGPAVHEITDEYRLPARRVTPRSGVVSYVTELFEQILELIAAPVDVTNDVEGSAILLPVVPERLALDDGSVDFLLGLEDMNVPEALAPEAAQRAVQLALLIADDVRAEVAFGP